MSFKLIMRSDIRRLLTRGFCIRLTSTRCMPSYTMCTQPKLTTVLNEASLRFDLSKQEFKFTFQYVDTEYSINRQLNFNRKMSETVDAFLRKIDSRIITETQKKRNKQLPKSMRSEKVDTQKLTSDSTNVAENKIALYNGNTRVDGTCTVQYLLEGESDLKLVVFDNVYMIKVNVPLVKELHLNPIIMVGFPTYPCRFEGEYINKKLTEFNWYRHGLADKKCHAWESVGQGYIYVPKVSDIGCKIKVTCEPRNEQMTGHPIDFLAPNPVIEGPSLCPFETRHMLTASKLTKTKFRITSYNILADVYTDSDYSRDVLFNYCPQNALSMNYRKQLILKELIGYNSDIICLQEVDKSIFENDLLPTLSTKGYNGRYVTKNLQKEGLATFYDENRFYVTATDTVILRNNVNLNNFSNVWAQITNDKIKQRFLNRSTTIQINALVPKESPNVILLVANTHLYYHPDADHIRLLQGYYTLEYLAQFARKLKEECPFNKVSVILCGDFNTTPDSGLYKLITTKFASEHLPDWKSNEEESVENVSLSHELNMASACGTPLYTNYTPNFSGCLDYIFYDTDSFEVEKVIEMPTVEEVSKHGGLPSIVFPSDHIALCAEMKWKT